MTEWTHDTLQHDLARYLRVTKDQIAWENMQLGPSGSPRPDVFAMGKTYSRFVPIAYECKISVADFRRDVTSGKWQSYLKYAAGVVFVAPAGLLSKDDIPTGCGLLVRGPANWKMLKGPTLRAIETLPHEAWIKMMIDGIARQAELQRTDGRGRASIWQTESKLRQKFGDEIAHLVREACNSRERLQQSIERDEERRREIEAGTERYAKMHRERIELSLKQLNHEQQSLAYALGLPDTATVDDLTHAIRKAKDRLTGDAEIVRLRRFIDRIKNTIEEASDPLPGDAQ